MSIGKMVIRSIAAENNLSETAFFVPNCNNGGYTIRWFTSKVEIDRFGHATLATAHIIFTEMSPTKEEIKFETKKASHPAEKIGMLGGMLSALRSEKSPISVYKARDYLLVYENEADIKELSPNFMALGKIDDVFAVIVTAPGDQVDFVSRFFAPRTGVSEDPVCGSAHCTLTPYWAERLAKNELHAYQISARKGELWCKNKGDRVLLSGKAVSYLTSEINI